MTFHEQMHRQIEEMSGYVADGQDRIARLSTLEGEDRLEALRELEVVSTQLRKIVEEHRLLRKNMMVEVEDGEPLFRPDYETIIEIVAPDRGSAKRRNIDKSGLHVSYLEHFGVDTGRVVEVQLKTGKVEVDSLKEVARFGALERLIIADSRIRGLEELRGNGSIRSISILNNSKIEDLSPLATLPNLKKCHLFNCETTSDQIAQLKGTTSLEDLEIGTNNLANLAGIEHLASLRKISIWKNPLADIEAISQLGNLEEVIFSKIPCISLRPLLECSGLRRIQVRQAEMVPPLMKRIWNWTPENITVLKELKERGVTVVDG